MFPLPPEYPCDTHNACLSPCLFWSAGLLHRHSSFKPLRGVDETDVCLQDCACSVLMCRGGASMVQVCVRSTVNRLLYCSCVSSHGFHPPCSSYLVLSFSWRRDLADGMFILPRRWESCRYEVGDQCALLRLKEPQSKLREKTITCLLRCNAQILRETHARLIQTGMSFLLEFENVDK